MLGILRQGSAVWVSQIKAVEGAPLNPATEKVGVRGWNSCSAAVILLIRQCQVRAWPKRSPRPAVARVGEIWLQEQGEFKEG